MELTSGRDGHFRVDARVDGRHIGFMVDTGASLVILRETDAANIGLHPMPRDYTAIVSTANGRIKAAPAKLDRIEVGDITVFDVPALVLPDEALSKNLLGVVVPVAAAALRIRRRPHGAGAVVYRRNRLENFAGSLCAVPALGYCTLHAARPVSRT